MIKYPGGEIAFWTILFILAGSFVSYTTFTAVTRSGCACSRCLVELAMLFPIGKINGVATISASVTHGVGNVFCWASGKI